MNSVDITIIQRPTDIEFECPCCGELITMDYDDFTCGMKYENPSEWEYDCFFCPECMEELEVGDVEWN